MRATSLIRLLALALIFTSCGQDTEQLLIGKWVVEKVEVAGETKPEEKQDLDRMKGIEFEFLNDGRVLVRMEDETIDVKWTLSGETLEIEGGSPFEIQEISETTLILKGVLNYYADGEIVEREFDQHMKRL